MAGKEKMKNGQGLLMERSPNIHDIEAPRLSEGLTP
jgi:hypothetical protein